MRRSGGDRPRGHGQSGDGPGALVGVREMHAVPRLSCSGTGRYRETGPLHVPFGLALRPLTFSNVGDSEPRDVASRSRCRRPSSRSWLDEARPAAATRLVDMSVRITTSTRLGDEGARHDETELHRKGGSHESDDRAERRR